MARDTSFSYSFLVLPAEQRRAIGVVWDFCRAVDDAVDEAVDPATAAVEVVKWRAEVGRLFGAETPLTPQAQQSQAVRRACSRCRGSRSTISSTASRWICDRSRYDTFDELVGYCRRVASAVGMMCIEVFGCRDSRSREYAFNLGLALQITNIIRDIKADLQQGRVYLPQEDLARFGVTEAGAGRGRQMTERFASCWRTNASARGNSYARPRRRCRTPNRASWSPPRSWAASTSRSCSASSAAATTCSPSASACRSFMRARIALQIWALSQLSAFGLTRSARA